MIRSWHAADWPRFTGRNWPAEIMHVRLTDRLHEKQGRSIARWTVLADGETRSVFIKRHFEHSAMKTMIATLLPLGHKSDAAIEWEQLRQADRLGIPTPRPLAWAEWATPFRLQSALIVEELQGMLALHEAIPLAAKLLPPPEFTRWKTGLIVELVRLVRLMHDHRYFHQDLYLCHFFVAITDIEQPPVEWTGRIALIDFHRMTRRWLTAFGGRMKDLAQLLFSCDIAGVTRRDVLRFWRTYRTSSSRFLRWLVRRKAERYRRHNQKRSAS